MDFLIDLNLTQVLPSTLCPHGCRPQALPHLSSFLLQGRVSMEGILALAGPAPRTLPCTLLLCVAFHLFCLPKELDPSRTALVRKEPASKLILT